MPQASMGFTGTIFMVNQRCSDPDDAECGHHDYTQTELTTAAQTNPGSWWIMGEEPNATASTNDEKSMTPTEYATWYHDKTQTILSGDRNAKFIFGYFGQNTPNYFSEPTDYARNVLAQWKILAAQNNWCPEPPMDAIHANYFPDTRYDGTPAPDPSDPNTLYDAVKVWRDLLFDGTADAWLANERLSIAPAPTYNSPNPLPLQEDVNQYAQATIGKLLDRKSENKGDYPYLLFLMNFAGYWDNQGTKIKSNQEENNCRPNSCPGNPPSAQVTDYGRVFSNFIYRNAGWEKGNLENWTQEDGNGNSISNYAILANNTTFTTEIKVQSAYVVQFIDSTSACASTACWLRSEKIPLPAMTAQASSFNMGLHYRVMDGTAKIRMEMTFYDSGGTELSTVHCTSSSFGVDGWNLFSCPESAPLNQAKARLSIKITPQAGSSYTRVRIDNAWARFDAP